MVRNASTASGFRLHAVLMSALLLVITDQIKIISCPLMYRDPVTQCMRGIMRVLAPTTGCPTASIGSCHTAPVNVNEADGSSLSDDHSVSHAACPRRLEILGPVLCQRLPVTCGPKQHAAARGCSDLVRRVVGSTVFLSPALPGSARRAGSTTAVLNSLSR